MIKLFVFIAIDALMGILASNKVEFTDDEIETFASTLDILIKTRRNLWSGKEYQV